MCVESFLIIPLVNFQLPLDSQNSLNILLCNNERYVVNIYLPNVEFELNINTMVTWRGKPWNLQYKINCKPISNLRQFWVQNYVIFYMLKKKWSVIFQLQNHEHWITRHMFSLIPLIGLNDPVLTCVSIIFLVYIYCER